MLQHVSRSGAIGAATAIDLESPVAETLQPSRGGVTRLSIGAPTWVMPREGITATRAGRSGAMSELTRVVTVMLK